MPEGDTVLKLANALGPQLTGHTVLRIFTRQRPPLRQAKVNAISAAGKHLFIEFDHGVVLRSHLGLYGSWHRYRRGEPWQKPRRWASIILETREEVFICFHAREVEWLRGGSIRCTNIANRLGPDLLGPAVDYELILRRAQELLEPAAPLMDLLLDQRVACGIGNIYKSELLFLCSHNPAAEWTQLHNSQIVEIYTLARDLLKRNLGYGPRTTRFVEDGAGRLWVYGRRGAPCFRCGAPVNQANLGRDLRSTYWCNHCQPPRTEEHRRPAAER